MLNLHLARAYLSANAPAFVERPCLTTAAERSTDAKNMGLQQSAHYLREIGALPDWY